MRQTLLPGLKDWAKWWTDDAEGIHLKMLIHGTSNNIAWDELPDDTNIVESMHNQYRLVEHSNLYVEMQNLFNIDRNAYELMVSHELGIKISYRKNSKTDRERNAKRRQDNRLDSRAPDTSQAGITNLPPLAQSVSVLCTVANELSRSQSTSHKNANPHPSNRCNVNKKVTKETVSRNFSVADCSS
jgi:hypothetical protein